MSRSDVGVVTNLPFVDPSGIVATPFGTLIINTVLMVAFLQTEVGVLMFVLLIGMGISLMLASPVLLAMVQAYMPNNRATANGVFLAITFVSRPIAGIIIGAVSDISSLPTAFFVSALLPLLSIPAILLLPESKDTSLVEIG